MRSTWNVATVAPTIRYAKPGKRSQRSAKRLTGARYPCPTRGPNSSNPQVPLVTLTIDSPAFSIIRHLRDEEGLSALSIDWERLLTINYREYVPKASVVIDIGAHHGMHSRRLLRYLEPAQLILVEPIPDMAARLRREFKRHRQVEVRQVALGDRSGTVDFVVNDVSPGESGLRDRHGQQTESAMHAIRVDLERLDDWDLTAKVDFIKLDVEGGEIDVLRGAARLLAENRPIVGIEYAGSTASTYGYDWGTIQELAAEAGYSVMDLFGNVITPDQWQSLLGTFGWEWILMPTELVDSLAGPRERVRSQALHAAKHPRPRVERMRKRFRR